MSFASEVESCSESLSLLSCAICNLSSSSDSTFSFCTIEDFTRSNCNKIVVTKLKNKVGFCKKFWQVCLKVIKQLNNLFILQYIIISTESKYASRPRTLVAKFTSDCSEASFAFEDNNWSEKLLETPWASCKLFFTVWSALFFSAAYFSSSRNCQFKNKPR